MEYTGERFIPGRKGHELLELEHRARYAMACSYAAGKQVLDLGSGSGYGSAMLAEKAAAVLGVDVAQEAVAYAAETYVAANLRFAQADLAAPDFVAVVRKQHPEPFACITCFEVLEHIEQGGRLLAAVADLLAPDGVFIVSTPNIDYPFDVDRVNPHHVREYTFADFQSLLCAHFGTVHIAGQQIHIVSSIGRETGTPERASEWRDQEVNAAKYFVAVCAAEGTSVVKPSGLLFTSDAHLKVLHSKLDEVRQDQAVKGQRIRTLESHLADTSQELRRIPIENRDRLNRLQEELKAEQAFRASFTEKFSAYDTQYAERGRRLAELQDKLTAWESTLSVRGKHIDTIEQAIDNESRRIGEMDHRIDESARRLVELDRRLTGLIRDNQSAHSSLRRDLQTLREHPSVVRLLRLGRPGRRILQFFGTGWKPWLAGKLRLSFLSRRSAPTSCQSFKGLDYKEMLLRTRADRTQQKMGLLSERDFAHFRKQLAKRRQQALVSIIMPTYNRAAKIAEPIESVLGQSYRNWELLIVDDGSTDDTKSVVDEYIAKDPRIRYIEIKHAGVSAARDTGLQTAKGEVVAYLDSDNRWLPDYLLFMVNALSDTGSRCGYCALRRIDHDNHGAVSFRNEHFVYDKLIKNNFIDINIFVHRRDLFDELGGFDRHLKRWVDWDLILRYVRRHDPVEVPVALCDYNIQKKLNQITLEESPAFKFKVLNKHLIPWNTLEAELSGRTKGLVSVVIPVFNQLDLTRSCVDALLAMNAGEPFEIILVDNGCNGETRQGLRTLAESQPRVRVVQNYENYWFALGNNLGVAQSKGEYIVLLNNDTQVTPGWLAELIDPLRKDSRLGVVGPKLLYEDDTIQCAGIVFSNRSKIPYHIYRGAPSDAPYVNKQRQFQALTGACLAVRAEDYVKLRGLDPRFANGCEDMDFCFRLRFMRGKQLLYNPRSVVYHYEGRTEGRNQAIQYNRRTFVELWGDKVATDDTKFYGEDGFRVVQYNKPGREPDGETAAYVPQLEALNGVTVPPDQLKATESSHPNAGNRTVNVGFVSIWHVRGVTFVAKQLADALDSDLIQTHILARWESDRFDNSGVVLHPRVMNGGDDPSPEETVAWARDNDLDLVIFVEVHPGDWKRVQALKQAGIAVMCYEHLDILRHEMLERYGTFDHYLFSSFHAREVFLSHFPGISSLVIPWGIPPENLPGSEAKTERHSKNVTNFIHVAGWGGYNNRKNTDLLVEAFQKANPKNAVLHLYTQADISKYGSECERVLSKSNLFVVHEGTVDSIFEAYEGMDMLLWPSKREGLGLPIVEALASGIPVLISDGYMMKQWIIPGEHGVVCPATPKHGRMYLPEMEVDRDALAKMIVELTNDPTRIEALKANVIRDRDLWLWFWQKNVFRQQILNVVSDKAYRPPDDLSYLPGDILEFERRRKRAFDESN